MEPWPDCPHCQPRGAEHDRNRYGSGTAFRSAAVILLHEAEATPDQIAKICRALDVVHCRRQ